VVVVFVVDCGLILARLLWLEVTYYLFLLCVPVCLCFHGSMMGTLYLFTMLVAALLIVGVAKFWYFILSYNTCTCVLRVS